MLLPRRILPSDTLENGFRVAHNETVDAMPDYSRCQVTDEGLLQFYNDLGQFIGEINLSAFRLQSDASGEGVAPQFYSASEQTEGVGKIASADAVAAGENQYDWVTPATLEYAFGLLKQDLIDASNKTLDQLTADKDFATDSTDAIDGVAMLKRLPNGKWEIVRNGYGNVGDALFNRLTPAQLTSIYYGLNNEGRLYLANLLKLGGPEFTDNFYISGDNNTVYINRPGDPRTARGMAFINRSVNAQGVTQNDLAARMGWTPEGYLEMFLAGKRTVEFRAERTIFNTPDVQGNFDLTARSLNVSETPLAESFAFLPGLFYNEAIKTWQVRYMGPKDYAAYLLSLPAFAQLQAAVVAPGATIIDHRILCHTTTVPAPTSQKITLSAAVDGQTIAHNLETNQLEYDAYSQTGAGAYKRDDTVQITDPTNTNFKLFSPKGPFTGYIRIVNATL